jgi:medium-chain acyl-[acyl-carrier-protein] hydrolase
MDRSFNNPWISFRKPRPEARLRLFCLPYAGAGASMYRKWTSGMPAHIEVCPIQLPGREERIKEPLFTRIDPLIETLGEALEPYLDLPFAFFGHSMGAILAFEAVHRLREVKGLKAEHLIVSGRRAPQLPPGHASSADLSDEEFVANLGKLNGTPPQVLQNRELMKLLLPVMRADFEVNNVQASLTRAPLECPMTILGGMEDEETAENGLEEWKVVTRGAASTKMFPGGHFFINQFPEDVAGFVAAKLGE